MVAAKNSRKRRGGVLAGVGDDRRHDDAVAGGDSQGSGRRYGDLLAHDLV